MLILDIFSFTDFVSNYEISYTHDKTRNNILQILDY